MVESQKIRVVCVTCSPRVIEDLGMFFFFPPRWRAQNSAQDSYTQSKVVLTNGEEGELCRDKSLASKARIVIAALESSSC